MAFNLLYFAPLGGQSTRGKAPQSFTYRTADSKATMDTANYFDTVLGSLEIGDRIQWQQVDDVATPTTVLADGMFIVKDKSTTHVDVADAVSVNIGGTTFIYLDVTDLSADTSYFLLAPVSGTISKISAVVDGAISTADVTITAKIATVGVTGGVVTLPTAASAAGTNASASPSALNTIAAGAAIELAVAGGGAGGAPRGHVVVEITRTLVDTD